MRACEVLAVLVDTEASVVVGADLVVVLAVLVVVVADSKWIRL